MRSNSYAKMIRKVLYAPKHEKWDVFYGDRDKELKKVGDEYSAIKINILDLLLDFALPMAYAGECRCGMLLESYLMDEDDWSERPVVLDPLSTKGFVECLKNKTSDRFVAKVCRRIACGKQRLEGDLYQAIMDGDSETYSKIVDGRGLDDNDEVYCCKRFLYVNKMIESVSQVIKEIPDDENEDFDASMKKVTSSVGGIVNEALDDAGVPDSVKEQLSMYSEKVTAFLKKDDDEANEFIFIMVLYGFYLFFYRMMSDIKYGQEVEAVINEFIEKKSAEYPIVGEFLRFNAEDFLSEDETLIIDFEGALARFEQWGRFAGVPVCKEHEERAVAETNNEPETKPSVNYVDSIIVDNYFVIKSCEENTYMHKVKDGYNDESKFRKLMNYIIKNDYIDGNEETIKKFLYVYTGRGEKPCDNGKIKWKGKAKYLCLLSAALYLDWRNGQSSAPKARVAEFFVSDTEDIAEIQKEAYKHNQVYRYNENDEFVKLIIELFDPRLEKKK